SCTCLFSADGNRCKHMAAVMYKWKGAKQEIKKERTLPVFKNVKDALFPKENYGNSFFKTDRMVRDLTIYEDTYQKAKRMLESGDFVIDSIDTDYLRDEDASMVLLTQGHKGGYYYGSFADLTLGKEEIVQGRCAICGKSYYRDYTYRRNFCEHMLALLLKADEYIRRYDPGDETNLQGYRILESFGKIRSRKKQKETFGSRNDIHLEPRITLNDDVMELSFRIGNGKLYVVRNLSDLVKNVREKASVKLGKNADLHFQYEGFDESSQPYYEYIERRVSEASSQTKRLEERYGLDTSLKGSIPLEGIFLDEFYELAYGKRVVFESKESSHRGLLIEEIPYKMPLGIRSYKKNDEILGIDLAFERPRIYQGVRQYYTIKGDVLTSLPVEATQMMMPFERKEREEEKVHIGKKHLPEFYYRILPELRKNPYIDIHEEDSEEILEILPPQASFDFYLDREDGRIFCKASVSYGEETREVRELREEDYPLEAFRDLYEEKRALDTIQKYFPYYEEEISSWYEEESDDVLFTLLNEGMEDFMAIGEVHGSESFDRLKLRRTPVVSLGVSLENRLMDLDVSSDDLSNEELLEVLKSYQRKKKYHRLKSGEFIALEENESLDVLTSILESSNIPVADFVKGKMHLPVYRSLYINKLLEEHESVAFERDRNFRSLIKNIQTIREADVEVPEELKGTLRAYQEYGYRWLYTLSELGFGGILADDMGLGKTLQMIALLLGKKKEGQLSCPALIITPASLVYNWEEECHRFAPSLDVRVIAGNLSARKKILKEKADVFVTSYDLLKRDIHLYEDRVFSFEILDEGQYIKNAKALISKAVKLIKSASRFVLTGTPIENRLSELWSLFDYLMPGFLYSYEVFRNEYETAIVKEEDEEARRRLKAMTTPFILRRKKEDVLKELPEKLEEVRYARFEEEQQKLYDGQVVHMKEMVSGMDESRGEAKIKILAELMKIRQICCDPHLLYENYEGSSAKKEVCLQLIESAIDGGHKMLVFSQFTSMLEILKEALKEREIAYYEITGETPPAKRLSLVHRFNEDDTPVFLISLKAGGTGLNLTGADIVIHYDPWWNLAVENQATDRAHRIGQTKKVTVYKIIARGSIEERILEMQEAKRDLSEAILSGENTSITSLSREELLELLN
ncbi:MAG: SNF2 helicase associated domain-containing protein, partial [Erysipelotrichaceae bacterium]|nr:SNF2 helicase associated domain-containing protein [Erysipelotrichaceae bacterium]